MRRTLVSIRRSIRTSLRLVSSYLQANWRLFLFSLVIGLVAIYSLPQIISSFSFRKIQTVGLVGNYTISTMPLSLQKEISLGLTTLMPDGQATSGAALSWTTSNGDKTITFNLDKNLFWQDGTKFDTSQINYNLKGVEVKRRSLYSLDFNFKEPFSPLPTIVSQPLFKSGLVGLGQYKILKVKPNGRFLASLTLQNVATGDKKLYKFYPTERMAAEALKLGVVSEVENIHQQYGLNTDSLYKIASSSSQNTIATIILNLRKSQLADKSLRQALAYAIPDEFPQGELAFSSLPKNSWAEASSVKKYIQNQGLAKENVQEVGSGSAQPKVILTTIPELAPVATEIAKSWNSIGVQTKVVEGEIQPEKFDAYLTYLNLPSDPDQYALWHSTQIGNLSGYKSIKSDRLLEDGRKTFNLKERIEIYNDFQKALSEDLPAIFLFHPTLYAIKRG